MTEISRPSEELRKDRRWEGRRRSGITRAPGRALRIVVPSKRLSSPSRAIDIRPAASSISMALIPFVGVTFYLLLDGNLDLRRRTLPVTRDRRGGPRSRRNAGPDPLAGTVRSTSSTPTSSRRATAHSTCSDRVRSSGLGAHPSATRPPRPPRPSNHRRRSADSSGTPGGCDPPSGRRSSRSPKATPPTRLRSRRFTRHGRRR
jgi:hypothetical protein